MEYRGTKTTEQVQFAGVIYGICDFLEKLGCRWLYPQQVWCDTELAPEKSTIAVETSSWTRASPSARSRNRNNWGLCYSPGLWWNHDLNGYIAGRFFYDVSIDPFQLSEITGVSIMDQRQDQCSQPIMNNGQSPLNCVIMFEMIQKRRSGNAD